ncbi:MAG: NosD domain-containing protein [bacterium]
MRAGHLVALTVVALHAAGAQHPSADIALRRGLVITRSVRIVRGVYDLPASPSVDSAVIVIRGSDITVDFNGAELRGAPLSADPDQAAGVAIRIEGGHDVHVLNARARGYRVGLMAVGTRALVLAGNDMSYGWKPRLFSVVEHESLVDWMSYHHNEQREWLRFGAGFYLEDVHGGELRDNRAEQGSSGVMLVRSDSLSIHDNTLSFNSGLGLGMYRSSWNRITHNAIDYDVRGYSHGFFRRGQDSAGLLMFEQSAHNVVADNSVTHGGDGLFLWAGQSTMDTGEGGANDNLYARNDFSFAPTNGMEATFSRNDFIGNRSEGSDYGLWGGYSYGSRVIGNCFVRNRVGIAIEHGQDNDIRSNAFDEDSTGVSLWANPIEPSDWGYPKHRDTRSRDYHIVDNTFSGVATALKILNTSPVDTAHNRIGAAAPSSCTPARLVPRDVAASIASRLPTPRPIPTSATARMDRSAIIVDEWGPFDWRSPRLWPVDSERAVPLRLRVVGPAGVWRLVGRTGVADVSASGGRVGDTLTVTPARDIDAWSVALEYRGAATVDPRGAPRAEGTRVRFAYGRFEPRTDWDVRFFRWPDTAAKALPPAVMDSLSRGTPMLTRHEPRLDYMWYRPTLAGLPQAHVALEATTHVSLAPGTYTLRTISDDAIRVWVDDVLQVDHWTPHESAVDAVVLAGGSHELRVQYAQVDGWAELRVEVVRGTTRSSGSAGPH